LCCRFINISNTEKSTEVLFSIGVETKEEVDEIFKYVADNGEKSFAHLKMLMECITVVFMI
jgi:predicted lactoylglutathione lyase